MQNTLIQEGKEMASLLYTYRSCVKALPQVLLCISNIVVDDDNIGFFLSASIVNIIYC